MIAGMRTFLPLPPLRARKGTQGRVAIGAVVALCVSACSSNSLEALEQEVASRARVGMPVEHAVTALEASGFKCRLGDSSREQAAELLCSRTRSYHLVSSCVQHVILTTSPKTRTVTAVTTLPPACAGL